MTPDESGVEVVHCPFEDCDWETVYKTHIGTAELIARTEAENHYADEHAGRVRVLVTLEREYQLGPRDPADVRESEMERFEDELGYEVAWVRSEVLEEADDHSKIERESTQEQTNER